MRDYVFYNVSCGKATGLGRFVGPCRRLVRRLLRPFFQRQVVLFEEMDAEIAEVSRQQALVNAKMDVLLREHEAVVRRLATLEDHLETLLRQAGAGSPSVRLAREDGLPRCA
jgi:hypothetical protein